MKAGRKNEAHKYAARIEHDDEAEKRSELPGELIKATDSAPRSPHADRYGFKKTGSLVRARVPNRGR
jgi:hypothetical protein